MGHLVSRDSLDLVLGELRQQAFRHGQAGRAVGLDKRKCVNRGIGNDIGRNAGPSVGGRYLPDDIAKFPVIGVFQIKTARRIPLPYESRAVFPGI
jgi:hypothetical protein